MQTCFAQENRGWHRISVESAGQSAEAMEKHFSITHDNVLARHPSVSNYITMARTDRSTLWVQFGDKPGHDGEALRSVVEKLFEKSAEVPMHSLEISFESQGSILVVPLSLSPENGSIDRDELIDSFSRIPHVVRVVDLPVQPRYHSLRFRVGELKGRVLELAAVVQELHLECCRLGNTGNLSSEPPEIEAEDLLRWIVTNPGSNEITRIEDIAELTLSEVPEHPKAWIALQVESSSHLESTQVAVKALVEKFPRKMRLMKLSKEEQHQLQLMTEASFDETTPPCLRLVLRESEPCVQFDFVRRKGVAIKEPSPQENIKSVQDWLESVSDPRWPSFGPGQSGGEILGGVATTSTLSIQRVGDDELATGEYDSVIELAELIFGRRSLAKLRGPLGWVDVRIEPPRLIPNVSGATANQVSDTVESYEFDGYLATAQQQRASILRFGGVRYVVLEPHNPGAEWLGLLKAAIRDAGYEVTDFERLLKTETGVGNRR